MNVSLQEVFFIIFNKLQVKRACVILMATGDCVFYELVNAIEVDEIKTAIRNIKGKISW